MRSFATMHTRIVYNRARRSYEIKDENGAVLVTVHAGGRTQAERQQMALEAPGLLALLDETARREPDHASRAHNAALLVLYGAVSSNGGPGQFYVRSQAGRNVYWVDTRAGTCTCDGFRRYGQVCKHLMATEFYQAMPATPCPDCRGTGAEVIASVDVPGSREPTADCERCGGRGTVAVQDLENPADTGTVVTVNGRTWVVSDEGSLPF